MEVEVLVPAAERRGVARVVEEPRNLAAQVLPVGAPGEHRLRQLRSPWQRVGGARDSGGETAAGGERF